VAIEIKQLHPLFVGEVSGVDLGQPFRDGLAQDVVTALDKYGVLVFHDQKITDQQQVAFSRLFGPIETTRYLLRPGEPLRLDKHFADVSNMDAHNRVVARDDRKWMGILGNRLWHTDSSFKQISATYSLLSAHVVTPTGGQTEFADMRAAYDALSDEMKERIENLVAEHSIFNSREKLGFTDFTPEERAGTPPVAQPMVRVHPGSGRKSLYIASHAGLIYGMPLPEARMLLLDLIEHATQPQFVYSHTWRVGDLVMWDNRCNMHRARDFDVTLPRDMRRTTVCDTANDKRPAAKRAAA